MDTTQKQKNFEKTPCYNGEDRRLQARRQKERRCENRFGAVERRLGADRRLDS